MNRPNKKEYWRIETEEILDIDEYYDDLEKYCDELEEVIKAYEYLNFCVSETLVDQSKMDISDELAFEKIRNDLNELDVKLWRIRR